MIATVPLRLPQKSSDPTKPTKTTFRLLELTPELLKIIETKDEAALAHITIRGKTDDEAVLCTQNATYSIRAVQISNSYLVVSGSNKASTDSEESVFIRDQVNHVMELVPVVPKLEQLKRLLRECQYKGEDEDESDEQSDDRPRKRRRFTHAQIRGLVQASDTELEKGLTSKRILDIDGFLQPLPSSRLTHILTLILTLLPTHAWKSDSVPLDKLADELQYEHGVERSVTAQICRWFGDVSDEQRAKWTMNEQMVVREVGLGILEAQRHEFPTAEQLTAKWREQVGDTFEHHVNMDLLSGNYVELTDTDIPAGGRATRQPRLKYFPASDLPANPSQRFADLFLTKKSWRGAELTPFLQDIAVDKKERDRLLMKFTRT
ncbi:hypothetical protein FRB99_000427, partial [Tulasnella sp. 403]